MPGSIIASTAGGEDEVRRWFEAGKTYAWMQEEYLRKYNLSVSITMFANLRARRGWTRRIAETSNLIPWSVKPEHRFHRLVALLRYEERRRSGLPLQPRYERELTNFLASLKEAGAVVHYDPDTDEGFFLVAREERDDDLIRRPSKVNGHSRT